MKNIQLYFGLLTIVAAFYLIGIACSPDEDIFPSIYYEGNYTPSVERNLPYIIFHSDSIIPVENGTVSVSLNLAGLGQTIYLKNNYSLAENSVDSIPLNSFYISDSIPYPDTRLPLIFNVVHSINDTVYEFSHTF